MASVPCLMILEKTRPSIILAAIVLRQPTVLSRPHWKTDPSLMHPERIDSMKLLIDALSDCPELFGTRNQILEGSHYVKKGQAAQVLTSQCYRVLQDLEEWEKSWLADVAHACVEVLAVPTAPLYEDSDGNRTLIWSTVFQ
jgi:hypothetical protein